MSKKIYSKLATAVILLLLVCANTNKGYSQFLGMYTYWYNDSMSIGNICSSDSLEGYIYWSHAGTYVPGDNVDITVDWGDGNTDSFLNLPITDGGGIGYANPVYPSHLYGALGNYTVIVASVDNYSYAESDTFHFTVSNLCGSVAPYVYLDNGDGIWGGGDIPMPGVDFQLTSPGPSYYGYSNTWGQLNITNIDVNQPSYTLQVDPAWLASTGMTVIDPVSGNYTVTGVNGTTQYFGYLLDCGSSTYFDASIYGWGWGFRPGLSTGFAYMYINNTSCGGAAVTSDISLDFDPMLTVYSTNLPGGSITSGNITWSGTSLPFGYSYVEVYFTVPAGTPEHTPLAFLGSVTATSATDVNPADNTTAFNSEVKNSWDPNDKSTNVGHYIDGYATEEIIYTVRFQNMGSADALNIHIDDTISNLLDLSSFRLLSMSHAGSYSIDPATRKVVFNFPNINLVPESVDEDLSQGYVMYSIKENAGLPMNSDIHNTAYIYFDSNPAVITNTTSNVNIANLGIEGDSPLSSVTVYPVPANTFVHIDGIESKDITGLKILDVNGKVVQMINQGTVNSNIQVSELPNGLYMLEITSGVNTIVKKICVQH